MDTKTAPPTIEQSDLFFNLQKTNYDALGSFEEISSEEIEAAIREDAAYCIENYNNTFGWLSVDSLTADFMRRL